MGKIRRRPQGVKPPDSPETPEEAHSRIKADLLAAIAPGVELYWKKRAQRQRNKEFQRVHTSATLAWAQANPEKSRSPDSFHKPDLIGPAAFVPAGQSGLYDRGPRMRLRKFHEYAVFLVPEDAPPGTRGLIFRAGFSEACPEEKECNKEFCAKCWARDNEIPDGYRVVVREVLTPDKAEIVDTTGVDPRGHKGKGSKMMLPNQKWTGWRSKRADE